MTTLVQNTLESGLRFGLGWPHTVLKSADDLAGHELQLVPETFMKSMPKDAIKLSEVSLTRKNSILYKGASFRLFKEPP